jgi:hypothetical protein
MVKIMKKYFQGLCDNFGSLNIWESFVVIGILEIQ